ncbi:hypothetical protein, partial [uncultured Mesorhizobium sp.]|uniref:hypothetical protein n=1 Tax=uncultured Mesorhizobium sp. TaxID=233795 RepID=UPI00260BF777
VDDDDFVSKVNGAQAARDAGFLITGDHDDGKFRRWLSVAIRTVASCLLVQLIPPSLGGTNAPRTVQMLKRILMKDDTIA